MQVSSRRSKKKNESAPVVVNGMTIATILVQVLEKEKESGPVIVNRLTIGRILVQTLEKGEWPSQCCNSTVRVSVKYAVGLAYLQFCRRLPWT